MKFKITIKSERNEITITIKFERNEIEYHYKIH
jgi:hypothetical protein